MALHALPGLDHLAIFAGGVCAGIMNAVAGGGTLVSFPILLWAGRDPVLANATHARALAGGSVVGGLIGAAVGRRMSNRVLEGVAIAVGIIATGSLLFRR
jgi:uncharacterized protein